MSGEDLAAARVRRMLPSVSEVLKELTARAPIEPEIAFRAAREICAEELKRIRDVGGEMLPLEDLVQRAFLRATGADPVGRPPGLYRPVVPPPAPVPESVNVAAAPAPAGLENVEDPFSETTGAMDLRWDRDAREPFSEPPVNLARTAGEPPEQAQVHEEVPGIAPVTETAPGPADPPDAPVPFALPADEDAAPAGPGPEVEASVAGDAADAAEPEPVEGPGNETLTRLSREAASIDLNDVFPHGSASAAAIPFALSAEDEPERRAESGERVPETVPFEDDEDTVLTIPRGGRVARRSEEGGSRLRLVLGALAGLFTLAALGYLLVGLWVERGAAPPAVAVARPRPVASPTPAPAVPAGATVAMLESVATPGGAVTPPAAAAETAPAAAIAEGQAAGEKGTKAVTSGPSRVPTLVPTAGPMPVARTVPTPGHGLAPAPAPVTTAPIPQVKAAVPVRLSRDGLVVTKDRAGQPQTFSIHFTSYKDRASAERDLKRISGLVGLHGYVAEVDLGEKGVWQRVMIGAFPTAGEAKAVREELAAKGTRDMGWVYRVVGPEAP